MNLDNDFQRGTEEQEEDRTKNRSLRYTSHHLMQNGPLPSSHNTPHFFSKSTRIRSYCRNADRKTKALLKCSNSCLNRPLPQRCMFTKVRFSSLHENLCKITQSGNILSSQGTQHCGLSFSSIDARTQRICQRACLSPNCAHLRTYLPTQVSTAFMELQSMKSIESVKCPSQHVQLLRRKLALLVRKEVHWHGAAFVLAFYSPRASCAIYLLIFFFIESTAFFFPLLRARAARCSVTEQIMAGYLFP